jgi:hypothetical protein
MEKMCKMESRKKKSQKHENDGGDLFFMYEELMKT